MKKLLILTVCAMIATPMLGDIREEYDGSPAGPRNGGSAPVVSPLLGTVLWDNGPLLTNPGGGFGGNDLSMLENTTLGMTTLGSANQWTLGSANTMADDFTVPMGDIWQIDQITVFNYQSFAPEAGTIAGLYMQIWDGDPSASGSVIWGDMTTNRMASTGFSGIYRAAETTPTDGARAIQQTVVTVDVELTEGTYWVDFSAEGNAGFSGPWMPPVTIPGVNTTGDGLQFFGGAWQPFQDGGTLTPLGVPFIIQGAVGGGPSVIEIPTLGELGLIALALMLALGAVFVVRR